MARTPLSIAVPLDGTDHALGLKQLEKFVSQKKTYRSQYKRFRGPFVEYLTADELKQGLRDWKQLFHCSPKDLKLGLAIYTIPGSLIALSERVDENLALYIVNYLYVVEVVVFMVMGPVWGILAFLYVSLYCWMKESLQNEKDESRKNLKSFSVRFLYPLMTLVGCLLIFLGLLISTGILTGTGLVLLHAGLHRAPSEFRYARQNRVVRWINRNRASLEGSDLLWRDLKRHFHDNWRDLHLSIQWKLLKIQDFLGLLRLSILHKLRSQIHKENVHLVKNSQ